MTSQPAVYRGSMNSDDERRVQKLLPHMEKDVDGKNIAPHLLSASIICLDDYEKIMGGADRKTRTQHLLDIILRRGPNAYTGLRDALERAGYLNIVIDILKLEVEEVQAERVLLNEQKRELELSDIRHEMQKRKIHDLELKVKDSEAENALLRSNEQKLIEELKEAQESGEELAARNQELQGEMHHFLLVKAEISRRERELEQKDRTIQLLTQRIADLQLQMSGMQSQIHKFGDKVRQQESQMMQLTTKIDKYDAAFEEQGKQMGKLMADVNVLKTKAEDSRKAASKAEHRRPGPTSMPDRRRVNAIHPR